MIRPNTPRPIPSLSEKQLMKMASEAAAFLETINMMQHPDADGQLDEVTETALRRRHAALVFCAVAVTLADPTGCEYDEEVVASMVDAYHVLQRLGCRFSRPFREYMGRIKATAMLSSNMDTDSSEDVDDGHEDDSYNDRDWSDICDHPHDAQIGGVA